MPSSLIFSNKLLCGRSFNKILERLAGGRYNVRRIAIMKGVPDTDGEMLVSHRRGPFPVYATFNRATGTVTLTSEADKLLVNDNACKMFYGFTSLGRLDAQAFDTSRVTGMNGMFYDCHGTAFDPDVSSWDVSNVKAMLGMFFNCHGDAFDPDVSAWDVSSVHDMRIMFKFCSGASFNPDVSGWDVSNVTDMAHMFEDCSGAAFNPDVSRWNLSPARLAATGLR